MRRWLYWVSLALGVLVAAVAAQAQSPAPPSVKIIDLGVLPGLPGSKFPDYSSAKAINNAGVVVGEASTIVPGSGCAEFGSTGIRSHHAFRWTPATGMQDLGALQNLCQSTALGIGDNGVIIGRTDIGFHGAYYDLYVPRVAAWFPGNYQIPGDLGTPPLCNGLLPFNCYVYASGINPAGDTVVGTAYAAGQLSTRFIWQQGQGFRDLAQGTNLAVYGINSLGVISCSDGKPDGSARACLLKPDGTVVDLAAGDYYCEAFAVNNNNEATGYCEPPSGRPDIEVFWDSAGNAHSLGGTTGFANGINLQGDVVGEDGPGQGGAFLWTKTQGLVYLSTLLPPGSGWRLDTANAINDRNQIVGTGVHNGVQRAFLLNLPPCFDAGGDTDGDGLCDDWEKNGVYVNVNGIPVFLDLPAMGADPNHKDIFVQLDTLGDGNVTQAALNIVIAAFANASVPYPDGTTGSITLHIDNGPDSIMNPLTGALWGDLSRSASISDMANLGSIDAKDNFDWGIFNGEKKLHFPAERAPAFHYAISEPVQILGADGTPAAAGIAKDIPSSDFIVAIGHTPDKPNGKVGSVFMHELGHNLGLHHGGGDDNNKKPNYLSIMNYAFAYSGLQPGNIYDYSRFGPDSDPLYRLPVLDELHLNERTGLGTPSEPVGAIALRYHSVRYCPGDDTTKILINRLDQPIDWNCDGDGGVEVNVYAEVNGEPSEDEVDGGDPIMLSPYDDWAHLVFNGGGIGRSAGAPLPSMTKNLEPTPAQLEEFADFWAAQQQDNIPPTTIVMLSPQPNAAGWNNQDVTVTLNATDNPGGSGVGQIRLSAAGAQNIASTGVSSASTSIVISAEGTTTVSFFATDNAGNVEAVKTVTVYLAKTPPTVAGANVTVIATGASTVVNYPAPVVTDAIVPANSIAVVCNPLSGSGFAIGVTTVNCTASDPAGNVGNVSFTVTVILGVPRLSVAIVGKGLDPSGARFYDLQITNNGTGDARGVLLTGLLFRTLAGTGAVTLHTSLSLAMPIRIGDLAAGAKFTVRIFLNVPSTATRFSIVDSFTLQNVLGTAFKTSAGQATTP